MVLILLIQSCSDNPTINDGYLKSNAETALAFTKQELMEYNTKIFMKLKDSLEKTSGFLGHKNIYKYFKSDDENLKTNIVNIWNQLYDKDEINDIVNSQILGLLSGTGLDSKNYLIKVKEDDSIKWYAEKISLSGFMLAFEYIIEFIVGNIVAFIIAFIISFFAAFLFGIDLSESTKLLTFVSILVFIIVMITTIKAEDKSQEILENKVIEKITNNTLIQVSEKMNIINEKYSKMKETK